MDVVIQQDRPSAPIAEFDSKVIAAARNEGLWNADSISQVTRFGCAQSFLLLGPSVFQWRDSFVNKVDELIMRV
jgi:hypothetical protein